MEAILGSSLKSPEIPGSVGLYKRGADPCGSASSQIFPQTVPQRDGSGGLVSHDGGEKWRRLMNISGLLTLALVPTRGWGADYGGGGRSLGQEVGISPLFTVKTGNGRFGSDPF